MLVYQKTMFARYYCIKTFCDLKTIRNYLNGFKVFHIFKEHEFPSLHDVQIRLTLRRLGKMLFHTPKQAAPISPEILVEIWRVFDFFQAYLLNILVHAPIRLFHDG